MTCDPDVWVLHDGKAGIASQAVGLAESETWIYQVADDTACAGAVRRALVLQRLGQRPPG